MTCPVVVASVNLAVLTLFFYGCYKYPNYWVQNSAGTSFHRNIFSTKIKAPLLKWCSTDFCSLFPDYRVGQSIRRLTCRHKFHQNCLDGYLLHQSNCCPICQQIVELNILRPNNQQSDTQSQISSSTKSQLTQKSRLKYENKLRDLNSRKSTKGKLASGDKVTLLVEVSTVVLLFYRQFRRSSKA